jgi:hypothetical protein
VQHSLSPIGADRGRRWNQHALPSSAAGGQYCSHSKRINELIGELGGRKRKLLEEGLAKLNATEDAKRHGDVSRDVTGDLAQQ